MDRGAWWATVHGVAKSQHDWMTNTFFQHFFLVERKLKSGKAEGFTPDHLSPTSFDSKLSVCVCAQSCLCNPIDCSPPGFSVFGVFPARILEWVAIFSSRGSFRLRDWTHVSCIYCIAGGFFTAESLGKPNMYPQSTLIWLKHRISITSAQAAHQRTRSY